MFPSEEAVFFNLGAIALQGVRKARIELGEATLVLGQGLIGLLAVQLSKLSGAIPVIAADLTDSRLERSKSMGADFALNPEDANFSRTVEVMLRVAMDLRLLLKPLDIPMPSALH